MTSISTPQLVAQLRIQTQQQHEGQKQRPTTPFSLLGHTKETSLKSRVFIRQTLATSSDLAVGGQPLPLVGPHRQPELLALVFLLDLGLQLEALGPVEGVGRGECERGLLQQGLQARTPGPQHGVPSFSLHLRRSPEDLGSQDLEAAVMQDSILQVETGTLMQTALITHYRTSHC